VYKHQGLRLTPCPDKVTIDNTKSQRRELNIFKLVPA
jgi:hypothetical protein